MTSIIAIIPQPQDATSLYRGIGPLQTMRRDTGLTISVNPEISWVTLKGADAVFFQRPSNDAHLAMITRCRANNKPIWIDYDDNLHAVPLCNRRFSTYGHPHIHHNIATILALADFVTASTPHLADSLRAILRCFPANADFRLNPEKIVVVPNAYDPDLHVGLTGKRLPRENLVVWRGSDSHAKDMMIFTDAMAHVIEKHQDWNYEFCGEPFWWTVEQLKKVTRPGVLGLQSSQEPSIFFRHLHKQRPALMIVPLEDQAFNRSKSNIAWIEATAAGAVTLAPDWPEWQKPGVIRYDGTMDFESKFAAFLDDEYDAETLWKQSSDYILENLRLRDVNKVRIAGLNSIVGDS